MTVIPSTVPVAPMAGRPAAIPMGARMDATVPIADHGGDAVALGVAL